MKARHFLILITVAFVLVLPADLWAQGCAMCKAVAASPAQDHIYGGAQAVGAGLNRGILFMMAIPYLLLFIFFRKKIKGFFKEFMDAKG